MTGRKAPLSAHSEIDYCCKFNDLYLYQPEHWMHIAACLIQNIWIIEKVPETLLYNSASVWYNLVAIRWKW